MTRLEFGQMKRSKRTKFLLEEQIVCWSGYLATWFIFNGHGWTRVDAQEDAMDLAWSGYLLKQEDPNTHALAVLQAEALNYSFNYA